MRHYVELVLLAALWGASFLFLRISSPEFGPIASDANLLAPYMTVQRYGRMPIVYLILAEQIG